MNKTTTAADLRTYYRGSEKRMARLSPEAQKTVAPGARGKVHPEAIADHNRYRKSKYSVGASKAAAAVADAERVARRAAAAEAGFTGKRGPLPKAFLAQSKG